jgi:hypothetical protein
MLIKVKTLTGKEIEIDIEPNDKVERIKERVEEKVIQSNGRRLVGKIPPQFRAVVLNLFGSMDPLKVTKLSTDPKSVYICNFWTLESL